MSDLSVSGLFVQMLDSLLCSTPGPAADCGCDDCPAVPNTPPGTTANTIRYSSGEAVHRADDLPGLTAGGVPWGHRRSFTSQLEFDQNVGQGWNWHVAQMPYLVIRDDEVVLMGRGQSERWFDRVGDAFAGRFGVKERLSYDAATESYTLRFPGGDVQVFGADGLFLRQRDPAGNQLVVEALVPDTQRPASVKRVTGAVTEQYLYAYASGGPAGTLLTSATLRRKEGSGPWRDVASAAYTYYGPGDAFGAHDDLRTVTTRVWQDSAWRDTGTTLYRYYLPQTGSGPAPEGTARGHLLKYVVKPATFDRLAADPAVSDPLTASDAVVGLYADTYFEYDGERRVTREARSGGSQVYDYTYETSPHPAGPHRWRTKTTELRPDGNREVAFTDADGRVILKALEAGSGPSPERWADYYRYDDGRVALRAHPEAVLGYNEDLPDLVDWDGSPGLYLAQNAGLVETFTYHAPTGWLAGEAVQEGLAGTPHLVRELEYSACCPTGGCDGSSGSGAGSGSSSGGGGGSGDPGRYFLAQETVYRDEDALTAAVTTYDYTFYPGTDCAVYERVTTLPLVALSENGSGVPNTRREVYDLFGRVTWSMDERGVVTHYAYDPLTGSLRKRVDDADTGLLPGVPAGWATKPQFGLHAVTDFASDALGRTVEALGPVHEVDLGGTPTLVRTASWTVHDDAARTTYAAQGYVEVATSAATLVNPVSLTVADAAGKTLVAASAVVTATAGGLAAALAAHGPVTQADYVRLSTLQYTDCCLAASSRAYHTIPVSGEGSPGTHYDQTAYGYDALKRRVRTVSPGGTVTWTVHDPRGLAVAVYVGDDDTGALEDDPTGGGSPGNTMVLVSETEYDNAGRPVTEIQHVDDTATRETTYQYDYRNRRLAIIGEEGYCEVHDYDFRGQVIRSEHRDATPSGTRLTRNEIGFDALGRHFEMRRYGVDPVSGLIGNSLAGRTWYNESGRVVKSSMSGSKLLVKSEYDGLGRVIAAHLALDPDEVGYSDAFGVADDIVLESAETAYDLAGHALSSLSKKRYHDADEVAAGPLGGPESLSSPRARVIYVANYYDGIGRPVAVVEYGTNGGVPVVRAATVPVSSDVNLVTRTGYDPAGNRVISIDPAGVVTTAEYDAAGRRIRSVENFDLLSTELDANRTTRFTYTSDGQLSSLTVENISTGDQTTTYNYGTTLSDSAVASSLLLRSVSHPDSTGPDDVVRISYNRSGERITLVDQLGTDHRFIYDGLGRLVEDRVVALGIDVDSAVRSLTKSYESRGLIHRLSSRDAPTGGNIVNQVVFTYNDFGQSIQTFQAHDDAVNTSVTPSVRIRYADGSDSTVRPLALIYPDGRELSYDYGAIGALDDQSGRVAAVIDDDSTHLADYSYLGANWVIRQDSPEAHLRFTLCNEEHSPDTGDIYGGLDRFGRIKDCRWHHMTTGEDLSRIRYGYDRRGKCLWRKNVVATAENAGFDWLYGYDAHGRLSSAQRGILNGTHTAMTVTTLAQLWRLDSTGNWENFRQSDEGVVWSCEQNRESNAVNEITDVSCVAGPPWASPVYDAAGNMIAIPRAESSASEPAALANLTQGELAFSTQGDLAELQCASTQGSPFPVRIARYDAWHRLRKLADSTTGHRLVEYQYDARHFRVKEQRYVEDATDRILHNYYTDGWRIVEQRLGESAAASRQFVWGIRYIDNLILRDQMNGADTTARLYALQDGSWSVTATVQVTGEANQRMEYSPYGSRLLLSASYGTEISDDSEWEFAYCGYRWNGDVELYEVRNRLFDPAVGSWVSRDPVGEHFGSSGLYAYATSSPVNYVDPSGLKEKPLTSPEQPDPCPPVPPANALAPLNIPGGRPTSGPSERYLALHFRWAYSPATSFRDLGGDPERLIKQRADFRDRAIQQYRQSLAQFMKNMDYCCHNLGVKDACGIKVYYNFGCEPYTDDDGSTRPLGKRFLNDKNTQQLLQQGILVMINLNVPGSGGESGVVGGMALQGSTLGGVEITAWTDPNTLSHELGHAFDYRPRPSDTDAMESGRQYSTLIRPTHAGNPDNLMAASGDSRLGTAYQKPDSRWCRCVAAAAISR